MIAKLARVLLPILLLMFLNPEQLLACRCVNPLDPIAAFERAHVVFSAVVLEKRNSETIHLRAGRFRAPGYVEWTMRVIDDWKGNLADTVLVYSAPSSASCGYMFKVEKEYLVYGSDPNRSFIGPLLPEPDWIRTTKTSACTRTKPLGRARAELEALPLPVRTVSRR